MRRFLDRLCLLIAAWPATSGAAELRVQGADPAPWLQAAAIAGLDALEGEIVVRVAGSRTTIEIRAGQIVRPPSTHPTPNDDQDHEALLFLAASWLHHLPAAATAAAPATGLASRQQARGPDAAPTSLGRMRTTRPSPPTEPPPEPPVPVDVLPLRLDEAVAREAERALLPTTPLAAPALTVDAPPLAPPPRDPGAPWLRIDGAVVGRPEHSTVGGFDLAAGWRTALGLRLGLSAGVRSPVRQLNEPVERPSWDAPILAWLGWSPTGLVAPHLEAGVGLVVRHLRQEGVAVATLAVPQAAARLGLSFRVDQRWRFVASAASWVDLQRVVADEPDGTLRPWQRWTVGGTLGVEWRPLSRAERRSGDPSARPAAPVTAP